MAKDLAGSRLVGVLTEGRTSPPRSPEAMVPGDRDSVSAMHRRSAVGRLGVAQRYDWIRTKRMTVLEASRSAGFNMKD